MVRLEPKLYQESRAGRYANVSRLDYMGDILTETGIRLAPDVAAGRLRKALATSLKAIHSKANRAVRRAG